MRALLWMIVVGLVSSEVPIHAQASTQTDGEQVEIRAQFQARLDELRAESGFPGASVAGVMSDGRTIAVSSGFSDLEAETPLIPKDRLLSGSIGKTYVIAVLLQLVDEGKLALDDRLKKYLGEEAWFERLPNHGEITLRQLLNHTSGVSEHVNEPAFWKDVVAAPSRVWLPAELVAYVLDRDALFAAGEGWSYADTNYILVGMVIERVTRDTFYGQLEKRVLEPLALKDTVPSSSRRIPGLVNGYTTLEPFGLPNEKTIGEDGLFAINPQLEWTGGGIASTTLDLARWGKLLYEGRAFPEKYLAEMMQGVPARTGRGDEYGLGVQMWTTPQGRVHGHTGFFPGYLSAMAYYPKEKVVLAIQFNSNVPAHFRKHPRAYLDDFAEILFR